MHVFASVFIKQAPSWHAFRKRSDDHLWPHPGEPLGRGLRRSELRHDSLWNTYVIDGLPVSPICNPVVLPCFSVLQPASTRDLYFVANGEGGHALPELCRTSE